jgi:hypothetical protein
MNHTNGLNFDDAFHRLLATSNQYKVLEPLDDEELSEDEIEEMALNNHIDRLIDESREREASHDDE